MGRGVPHELVFVLDAKAKPIADYCAAVLENSRAEAVLHDMVSQKGTLLPGGGAVS